PVGIPSLEPAVRGATLGPMAPAERLRSRLSSRNGQFPFSDPLAPRPTDSSDCGALSAACASLAETSVVALQLGPSKPIAPRVRRRGWWHPGDIETQW